MKAPFPYFGGKSRCADIVWNLLGDVPNYVEPFAGSLAILLARPHDPGIETVNDADCFIANFWRALKEDPEGVAGWADWPVNECDLEARHLWLVNNGEFKERMKSDPEYYDSKVAGWWVWGISQWIGSGWCSGVEWKQLPHLGDAGRGVHQYSIQGPIYDYMRQLSERLRRVRVCCGDFERVLGPSVTFKHGLTGVVLDPPYADTAGRTKDLYSTDCLNVAHRAREWAIANGDNPKLRILLFGYEGEHEMPADWECIPWKAVGGYGLQSADGRGRENSNRERIWASPNCLKLSKQATLFEGVLS